LSQTTIKHNQVFKVLEIRKSYINEGHGQETSPYFSFATGEEHSTKQKFERGAAEQEREYLDTK